MAETRARDLASSLGQAVKKNNILINGNLAITGIETYTNKSLLPGSYDSDDAGSLGFTTDSDRLYIHTGTAWHNIAIINTNPIWETQPSASYTLATDATAYKNGTATTITLAARDSEGAAIQWSAVPNTAFNNIYLMIPLYLQLNLNQKILQDKKLCLQDQSHLELQMELI